MKNDRTSISVLLVLVLANGLRSDGRHGVSTRGETCRDQLVLVLVFVFVLVLVLVSIISFSFSSY